MAQLSLFAKTAPHHIGYLKVKSLSELSNKLLKASEKVFSKSPANPIEEVLTGIKNLKEKVGSLTEVIKINEPIVVSFGYFPNKIKALTEKESEKLIPIEQKIKAFAACISVFIEIPLSNRANFLEMVDPMLKKFSFLENYNFKLFTNKNTAILHNTTKPIFAKRIIEEIDSKGKLDLEKTDALFNLRINTRMLSQFLGDIEKYNVLNWIFESGISRFGAIGRIVLEFYRQAFQMSPSIQGVYLDIVTKDNSVSLDIGVSGSLINRPFLQVYQSRRNRSLAKIREQGQVLLPIKNSLIAASLPLPLKDFFDTIDFSKGDNIYLMRDLYNIIITITDVIFLDNTKYSLWKAFNSTADFYLYEEKGRKKFALASESVDYKNFQKFMFKFSNRLPGVCGFIGIRSCKVEKGSLHSLAQQKLHFFINIKGQPIHFFISPELSLLTNDFSLLKKSHNLKRQPGKFRQEKILKDILPSSNNKEKEFAWLVKANLSKLLQQFSGSEKEKTNKIKGLYIFSLPVNGEKSSLIKVQLQFKD